MKTPVRNNASGGSLQLTIGVALCAFLLGGLAVGYFAWRDGGPLAREALMPDVLQSDSAKGDVEPASIAPSPSASVKAKATEAANVVRRVEEQQGGLDQRLAAAEQRLNRLDLQSQASAGNAARAEGLLIAFAARRSIERGAELGYLADQLQLRFGDALPNAVDTVVDFSRNPVTLDTLIARLDGLEPKLTEATEEPSFSRFKREFSELFVVRRESAPSPQPSRRVERARLFLESGRINAAMEEVSKLPGADNAKQWLADAERYAVAQKALDLIETSAVLEPRRLRDRTGQHIEQPSPASANATPPAE